MRRTPSPNEVAESRQIVCQFGAVLRDHGPLEAAELREEAWSILLADHAIRLIARRRRQLLDTTSPGDAA